MSVSVCLSATGGVGVPVCLCAFFLGHKVSINQETEREIRCGYPGNPDVPTRLRESVEPTFDNVRPHVGTVQDSLEGQRGSQVTYVEGLRSSRKGGEEGRKIRAARLGTSVQTNPSRLIIQWIDRWTSSGSGAPKRQRGRTPGGLDAWNSSMQIFAVD